MKKKEPKVSVVIVNYNGKEDTLELLKSLKKIDYENCKIIVVDNKSIDGSQKIFRNFKEIIFLENEKNVGLAEGTNVGIREALRINSDYILIMNNDMYVDEEFLKKLVEIMEEYPEAAVAGPKIYYANPKNMIWSAGCDYKIRGFRSRHQEEIDSGQSEKEEFVDALDCVLIIRSNALNKIGLLDSSLFIMHEFTGWCLRARKEGYKILYVPQSKAWHKVSATLNKNKKNEEITLYYDVRNWLIINKKNTSKLNFLFILFYESTALFFVRFLKYIKKGRTYLVKTYFIAVWHALINKTPLEMYPYKKD